MKLGHLEGEQPYLEDILTRVINHLLTGMILQVGKIKFKPLLHGGPTWLSENYSSVQTISRPTSQRETDSAKLA